MDALLIKVPEAAAQLGISRAKLYELIGSGALPTVKVGGCRRVDMIRMDMTLPRRGCSVCSSAEFVRLSSECFRLRLPQ